MVQVTEGKFEIDGASLHSKTWLPDGEVKAKLIFFHGFSDHIDRYYDFFPSLARRGIATYGIDQRGWGKSAPGKAHRGRTGPTTRVMADMAAFIKSQLPSPDAPVFVLGHSMGGGQVLTFASTPEYDDVVAQVRGWLLESPFVGFAPELKPNWFTVASGKLAARVVPNFQMVNVIPPENLTRDPEVQKSLHADELVHNTGTLEGLAGMLDRTGKLSSGELKISGKVKSLFMTFGTEDKATSYDLAKAWFDRQTTIPDAEFKSYDGAYHMLHADLGCEKYYEDTANWILARAGGGDGSTRTESAPAPAPAEGTKAESKL
ncbi:hydrolase [Microdochium trichocladiopsis]|uniref:Hydrolase n=1 Tax=Microdochium trichocladiopsis TaxID=1682393 RepID=A0A9P9BP64_9PEZI|nr:hydrolase [Microdochium trichocladiopsis]KAH7032814.1 hydrolase [Microdochium trichocladiopsis]